MIGAGEKDLGYHPGTSRLHTCVIESWFIDSVTWVSYPVTYLVTKCHSLWVREGNIQGPGEKHSHPNVSNEDSPREDCLQTDETSEGGWGPQRLTTVEVITTPELKRQPTKGEKGVSRARQLPWKKADPEHKARKRINRPPSPLYSCLSCLLWTKTSQVPACKQAQVIFP